MLHHALNQPGFNPFAEHLGITFTRVEGGESECSIKIEKHHFHPGGVVHGGVACALADTAMATALISTFEKGENCVTIEMKTSYIASLTQGTLQAKGAIIKKGRRIAFMEAEIHEADRLIAKATATFAILQPR